MKLVTWTERPELAEHGIPSSEVWPEYNLHGDVFDEYWGALERELPEFQFALLEGDVVVAEGHTIPLAWDGDDVSLLDGIDAALRAGVLARRAGAPVDTLCAMAAEVSPSARSRGLAAELLRGMSELARRHGLKRLIAPVRPSWKERYPLTPIERYVTWRRDDGQLFDPWMRLHERLGARVATPLPRLDADHRQRRRVGVLDRPGLSRGRRLRLPARPRPAPRRRRDRPLLRTERLARPPAADDLTDDCPVARIVGRRGRADNGCRW